MTFFGTAWRAWLSELRELSGFGSETLILPRWVFLRLLGVAYLFAFADYCVNGVAMVGPGGLEPVGGMLQEVLKMHSTVVGHLLYPSLFWLSSSAAMVTAVAWGGMLAGLAATFNLWPRLSLAVCWFLFASFAGTTRDFSPTIVDSLILETTLMAIPFAPAGVRPGLGRDHPPSPWATLFMRYLVVRVLFQAGLGKLVAYDGQWRNFEYMNLMHEHTPFPTYLAFLDHSLPRAWHAVETGFTLAAELGAAFLVFASRKTRVVGVVLFTLLQTTIWATSNFGWLNSLAISLCVLLLDDRMLARLKPLAALLARAPEALRKKDGMWKTALWSLMWVANAGLGTALVVLILCEGGNRTGESAATKAIMSIPFKPAGRYTPFMTQYAGRYLIELAGTQDLGRTWQPYGYKYVQQDETRMCPWIAPYFARFDAAIQKYGMNGEPRPVFRSLGRHLLAADPVTLSLFRSDPFRGRAPQAIRFMAYQLRLNDWATYRATGHFWRREYLRDFIPMVVRDRRVLQIWGLP